MHSKIAVVATLCGIAIASSSAPANAATSFKITGWATSPVSTHIKDSTRLDESTAFGVDADTAAGAVSAVWNSGVGPSVSFATFCTDIYDHVTVPGGPYTGYSLVNPSATTFGVNWSGKATDIGRLMTKYGAYGSDATKAAALQFAIWEIVNEKTATDYKITADDFRVTSPAGSSTVLTKAQSYLDDLGTDNMYQVKVLYSATHQDFLFLTPVPEPETYAMFLAGLGMMGAVAKRRRARA